MGLREDLHEQLQASFDAAEAAIRRAEINAGNLIDEALKVGGQPQPHPGPGPDPEPDPEPESGVLRFEIPDLLCQGCSNERWTADVSGEFREIRGGFSLRVGKLYSVDPTGWYCLFWLQPWVRGRAREPHWEDTVLYVNDRGPLNRIYYQTNIGTGAPHGRQGWKPGGLVAGGVYEVEFSYAVGGESAVRVAGVGRNRLIDVPVAATKPIRMKQVALERGTQAGRGREAPTEDWEWTRTWIELVPA